MQLLSKTLVIALLPWWLAGAAVAAGQPAVGALAAVAEQTAVSSIQPELTTPPEPEPQPAEAESTAEPENTEPEKAEPDKNDPDIATQPTPEPEVKPEPRQNLAFQRQEAGSERSSNSGIGLGKIAISLAAVLLLVVALGWIFKKLTLRLPGSQHIKVICSVPLGQRERLLVIEIQGKQRVLGVTPQSINLLFELENSLPETKLASDFHTQLQSFLKK